MFADFDADFRPDLGMVPRGTGTGADTVGNLQGRYGGMTFNGGLYRVLDDRTVNQIAPSVFAAFPDFADSSKIFGMDWLGRVFAETSSFTVGDNNGVMMFEPGTGEALEIPCDVLGFHNEELVDNSDAALASSFFDHWVAVGGGKPGYDQCIGYKKPLFFGGADDETNLEVSDVDVYWTIAAQLIARARGLKAGDKISSVGLTN